MTKILSTRKSRFESVRPDVNDNVNNNKGGDSKKFNKFVVDVSGTFDFGKRFYYHDHYKNNTKRREPVVTGAVDYGNLGYSFSDLYVG
eukprot:217484_1